MIMDSHWRHMVDVSSFLLFEATGDSEDSSHDISDVDDAAVDDDAESCCSGPCGAMDEDNNHDSNGNYYSFDDQDCYTNQESEAAVEEEMLNEYKKEHSGVNVDANGNGKPLVLNETEKNKRFWETCLAS